MSNSKIYVIVKHDGGGQSIAALGYNYELLRQKKNRLDDDAPRNTWHEIRPAQPTDDLSQVWKPVILNR